MDDLGSAHYTYAPAPADSARVDVIDVAFYSPALVNMPT